MQRSLLAWRAVKQGLTLPVNTACPELRSVWPAICSLQHQKCCAVRWMVSDAAEALQAAPDAAGHPRLEEDHARLESSRDASTSSMGSTTSVSRSLDAARAIQDLPLPKTGKALAAIMSGIKDNFDNNGEQGGVNGYTGFHWRFFERYLDSIRPLRGADGSFPEAVLPPMHVWNGYFMSLSMDRQSFGKVYKAVQVAEQEFNLMLPNIAYLNVLRVCGLDGSEAAARFAIKVVDGLKSTHQGPGRGGLNFAALACRTAAVNRPALLDDALRFLRQMWAQYPEELAADHHAHRTHGNVLWALLTAGRFQDSLALITQMADIGWTPSVAAISRCLYLALGARSDAGVLLRLLAMLPPPPPEAAAGRRPNAPHMEEGLAMPLLSEAARLGNVELAMAAWDCMEIALMPLAKLPPGSGHAPAEADREAPDVALPRGDHAEVADQDLRRRQRQQREAGVQEGEEGQQELRPEQMLPAHVPSVAAFQALIDTYANARRLREAFGIIHQLQRVHPDRPEAVAFEAALAAVVDAAARSPEAVDATYFELEDMRAKGEPVSNPMLDCVVAACSQMGDIGRAFETFEAYSALGLRPDAQAFNAVLVGCITQGITQPVPKILADMEASGVAFNALTHALCIDYHVVIGDAHGAAEAFFAARAAGEAVRPATFDRLMSRCERNGEQQLLDELSQLDKFVHKDSHWDLARIKRWRWRDKFGLQALTGSHNFIPRRFPHVTDNEPTANQHGKQNAPRYKKEM